MVPTFRSFSVACLIHINILASLRSTRQLECTCLPELFHTKYNRFPYVNHTAHSVHTHTYIHTPTLTPTNPSISIRSDTFVCQVTEIQFFNIICLLWRFHGNNYKETCSIIKYRAVLRVHMWLSTQRCKIRGNELSGIKEDKQTSADR